MSGSSYFRKAIEALASYVPGIQPEGEGWLKLKTNEGAALEIVGKIDRSGIFVFGGIDGILKTAEKVIIQRVRVFIIVVIRETIRRVGRVENGGGYIVAYLVVR